MKNYYKEVVKDFGNEWSKFDYINVVEKDQKKIYDAYFKIFPWHRINKQSSIGIDIGCGTGRWAKFVTDKTKELILLDASEHMNWVFASENGKEYTLEGTGEITIPTEETFTLERKAIIPIAYTLHQNYPNPFNPITSLRYDLSEQAQVTLTVYDLMGREVTQLVNTTQDADYRSVQWDATDMHGKPVSAGVYIYQILAGEFFVQTRKMVLLK